MDVTLTKRITSRLNKMLKSSLSRVDEHQEEKNKAKQKINC